MKKEGKGVKKRGENKGMRKEGKGGEGNSLVVGEVEYEEDLLHEGIVRLERVQPASLRVLVRVGVGDLLEAEADQLRGEGGGGWSEKDLEGVF